MAPDHTRASASRQLLAQEQVLRDQGTAVAAGRPEQRNEEEQVLDHRRR
jgi:hypothetical protein